MAAPVPKHKAALYFNELAPLAGGSERCALFGHFYHPPEPDALLTRPVAALPDGGWTVVNDIDVNDIVCGGIYLEEHGTRRLFAVFRSGETYVYQGTARTALPIPPKVGFLSGLRHIAGAIYACGSQNAVYRFDGAAWTDIAPALRVPYGGTDDPILNAIDGFGANDLYAVGYDGAMVRFDGAQWSAIGAPTNQHLHQLLCHADGTIYLCGRGGTIFRGTPDAWEDLSLPGFDEDFWGLAAFGDQVFAATYHRLFRIDAAGLVDEAVPINSAGSFYRLAGNDAYLWATTGTGRILRYDGRQWIELTWPDST